MQTKITKWGNSYGIRIPKEFLKDLELQENQIMYITKKNDMLMIQKPKKDEILANLLENIKEQKEYEWGDKTTNEFW